jgi:polypeptide N-acetylgalactosaminyltransferase
MQDEENRGLRLKGGLELLEASPGAVESTLGVVGPGTSAQGWGYLDEKAYIANGALRPGEDPYARNRFNQQASDSLPSNRHIPDTRAEM